MSSSISLKEKSNYFYCQSYEVNWPFSMKLYYLKFKVDTYYYSIFIYLVTFQWVNTVTLENVSKTITFYAKDTEITLNIMAPKLRLKIIETNQWGVHKFYYTRYLVYRNRRKEEFSRSMKGYSHPTTIPTYVTDLPTYLSNKLHKHINVGECRQIDLWSRNEFHQCLCFAILFVSILTNGSELRIYSDSISS